MTTAKTLTALVIALGLSACAQVDTASRRATADLPLLPNEMNLLAETSGARVLHAQYDVEAINIVVPTDLKVSEANAFYPRADIVWRGEPRGDRYAQVSAIFSEAISRGTASMASGRQVAVDIEVMRFHCLTEKTRYTVGGTHSLKFEMTVRDVATGEVIDGPRLVVADIAAAGGARAIAEDEAGRTQRVVVVERLAEVIRRELSAPATEEMVARFQSGLQLTPAGLGQ
jgi:hypothetical protein